MPLSCSSAYMVCATSEKGSAKKTEAAPSGGISRSCAGAGNSEILGPFSPGRGGWASVELTFRIFSRGYEEIRESLPSPAVPRKLSAVPGVDVSDPSSQPWSVLASATVTATVRPEYSGHFVSADVG